MKKALALFLALLMLVSMMACSAKTTQETAAPAEEAAETKTEETSNEVTSEEAAGEGLIYEGVPLRVCMAPMISDDVDKAFWTEQCEKFEESTGADVTVEIVSWEDMATKYLTAFMSNDAADVLYFTNETVYDFLDQGCLMELDSYWSEEELANENFWETATFNGKHYYAPFYGGSCYRVFCYNMDILNECGVTELPTTWEEFLDVCEIIHTARPDIYTYLMGFSGNAMAFDSNLMTFITMAGGSIVNEDHTKYTFDTPEALKAMNFMKTLMDKGYLSEDCIGMDQITYRDLFLEGKAAITQFSWNEAVGADFEWQISTDLHDVTYASFNPIDSIAVNAKTEYPEASIALMKFLRSAEVMSEAFEQLCPDGQTLKDYPNVVTDEHMTEVLKHPERSFVIPVAPNIQKVIDSAITNQQLMLMGTLTPEEALAQIQAEADKAVS